MTTMKTTACHTGAVSRENLIIQLSGVEKWYGEHRVLTNFTAEVERGQVVVLCGPSGSGKSTLIRTLNRLEEINSGTIRVNGQDVQGKRVDINTLRSHIGFVFQQFNLFPTYRCWRT